MRRDPPPSDPTPPPAPRATVTGAPQARAPAAPPLPLSRATVVGRELDYVAEAARSGKLSGDGPFTRRVAQWLASELGAERALLTTSGTSALELAALLLRSGEGDEVIVPSFTFVTSVSAFVLHNWRPVFCDIGGLHGNVTVDTVAAVASPRTRAVVAVHYAGVPCDVTPLLAWARPRGIAVIEDAAQAVTSTIDGRAAGTLGDLGCYSFHDTKNFVSGEGGALLVNRAELLPRAEILREKGTNRSQFLQGHIDKYTWVDVGSSFLASDLSAAFLLGQLEQREAIAATRAEVVRAYRQRLAPLHARGLLELAPPPRSGLVGNDHLFYVVLPDNQRRNALMRHLNAQGIGATFHYLALHKTPQGSRYHDGRALPQTERMADCLLRLPLFVGMPAGSVDRVCDAIDAFFEA